MKFDFFGQIPDRKIVRLMTLVEFIGDGLVGQTGFVAPEFFFWCEPPGELIQVGEGASLQRHLRLLGNALVADQYRPNKKHQYSGHVVMIQVQESGLMADFSMVESIDLSEDKTIDGETVMQIRRVFGSVGVFSVNLESLA